MIDGRDTCAQVEGSPYVPLCAWYGHFRPSAAGSASMRASVPRDKVPVHHEPSVTARCARNLSLTFTCGGHLIDCEEHRR